MAKMKDRGQPPGTAKGAWGVDRWEGDRQSVQDLWPGDKIGVNEHQHVSNCGGYYVHSHPEGQTPHEHDHKRCRDCRGD